jgi:enolase
VKIGIDSASSEFFHDEEGLYDLAFKQSKSGSALMKGEWLDTEGMMKLYNELLDRYPIALLEDPFAEDDWQAWTRFNATCPVELVGDDLLATNKQRIITAHEKKACNVLLLKINQIGTVTEAIDAAKLAYSYSWSVFVSHRSGETIDDFIADLTVGLSTGHLKSGSPCRGERVAKYNRLMDIEQELEVKGARWIFAGKGFRELSWSR